MACVVSPNDDAGNQHRHCTRGDSRHVGHGRRTDIASYRVKIGDRIELCKRSEEHAAVVEALDTGRPYLPWFLESSNDDKTWVVTGNPGVADIPFPLDLKLIIEYYSRLL